MKLGEVMLCVVIGYVYSLTSELGEVSVGRSGLLKKLSVAKVSAVLPDE